MIRVFSNSLEERERCAQKGMTEEVLTEFRMSQKTGAMKSRTFPQLIANILSTQVLLNSEWIKLGPFGLD